ncbi:hypothetical protein AWZ03_014687, partial [Drosophila navojoa]
MFVELYTACLIQETFTAAGKIQNLVLLPKAGKARECQQECWGFSYGMSYTTAYCAWNYQQVRTHIGFADDVAVVAIGKEDMCSESINRIRNWLTGAGLELAAHKTEVVL